MGYHNTNVHIMEIKDGSIQMLTGNFDRSIDDVQWAGNSNRLYVQYDNFGSTHIGMLSMNGYIDSIEWTTSLKAKS